MCFPRGVIMCGPSGVGKSLLARALCSETAAYSVHLSASELLLANQDSDGKLQEIFKEVIEK